MSTDTDSKTKYPLMTPQALAEELGVSLSQRLQPRLDQEVPKRFVTLEEAKARGLSWFWDGTTGACRYGHNNAARRTSNQNICSDCERAKESKEPIYGQSRVQKYYEKPRRAAKDLNAPVMISAPAAQPAQIEPSKKEQDFLAAAAEHRDIDKAAAAVGWTRSQIEARSSVNEVFRKAMTDLTDRLGIATRAPDAETYRWTPEIEKAFSRRYVDCGLIEQTRTELGISASDYHEHLEKAPAFAALVAAAEPLARLTLRDRATAAAEKGNDRLLKILEIEAPEAIGNMSTAQCNAEIEKLLLRFQAQGLFPTERQHKVTGERIDLVKDYEYVKPDSSNADLVS